MDFETAACPPSSDPATLDGLLSSLLVRRDGKLVPASSASSARDGEGDEASGDLGVSSASEQTRRAGHHVSRMAAPRVKDIGAPRPHAIDENHRPNRALYKAAQDASLRKQTLTTLTSPSSSAEATLQSKLSHNRARRSSSATPSQRMKANLEAFGAENIPPPSGQMAASHEQMVFGQQDANMENPPSSQDFAFESNIKLDIVNMQEWDEQKPYTPPAPPAGPRPPPRDVVPMRLEHNHGKDAQAFNTECQRRGIQHEFKFEEKAKGCHWVTLLVNGERFYEDAGPYANQKDAKEAICRVALGKIHEIGFKKPDAPGGKKRKSSEFQSDLPPGPVDLENEQWIAIVNTYTQQNKLDYPEYTFSEQAPWTCTMRFQGSPFTQFGSAFGPFKKKDDAKKAAAMEAVKWLRACGKVTDMAAKRRKSSARQPPPNQPPVQLLPGQTGLTQSFVPSMDVNATGKPPGETFAKQVFEAARALGFNQPKFDTERLQGDFVNESASFADKDVRYEPRLAGTIGQVHRVYGKKAAHEECCRLVLQVLKEIEQSRMA